MYAANQVIGAHNGQSAAIFDAHPKWREVDFVPGLLGNDIADGFPIRFLVVPLEVLTHPDDAIALLPFDYLGDHRACEERVFAGVFKTAPSLRHAQHVHAGSLDHLHVHAPRFLADDIAIRERQLWVE
jgi:hypothetical protein